MARRRFQDPQAGKLGRAWYIRVWEDIYGNASSLRQRTKGCERCKNWRPKDCAS
jgi:hypothetical protein